MAPLKNSWVEFHFPALRASKYEVTSPADFRYNCIAWAAGDSRRFWDPPVPVRVPGTYWPPGVPAERTLAAFVQAYETVGFTVCASDAYEPGFEKVVIYADHSGVPKHAARQREDGAWLSKLGQEVDIVHYDINGVSGAHYGQPRVFLRRIASSTQP